MGYLFQSEKNIFVLNSFCAEKKRAARPCSRLPFGVGYYVILGPTWDAFVAFVVYIWPGYHKCFKCWWLALPEKKRITKPLINSTFNNGLHEGPSYTVPTIITELLRQFESWRGLLPNFINIFLFGSLEYV